MLSGCPGAEDAIDLIPKTLHDLRDIPTLWVTEACQELSRTWTNEFRAPQSGNVREVALSLWAAYKRDHETDERRREFAHQQRTKPLVAALRGVVGAMRTASARIEALSPAELEAKHHQWLEEDVARGRLTRQAAENLRTTRGAVR